MLFYCHDTWDASSSSELCVTNSTTPYFFPLVSKCIYALFYSLSSAVFTSWNKAKSCIIYMKIKIKMNKAKSYFVYMKIKETLS